MNGRRTERVWPRVNDHDAVVDFLTSRVPKFGIVYVDDALIRSEIVNKSVDKVPLMGLDHFVKQQFLVLTLEFPKLTTGIWRPHLR